MNWKRRIAKEWLWFVCTVVGGILVWNILPTPSKAHDLDMALVAYVVICIGRITIWAIREIRKKEG